jgi:hypothetical protein
LTDADRAMHVLSDQIIRIGQDRPAKEQPQHPVRLVVIKMKPHTSKGKYKGGSTGADCDGFLPKSSHSCMRTVGPSRSSSASSKTCWAADTYSATTRTESRSRPTARSSPVS